jgi:hypothetical protein
VSSERRTLSLLTPLSSFLVIRVPVGGQLGGFQQAHLAGLGHQDTGLDQAGHRGVLGLRELLGDTVIALGKAGLLEPG